MNPCVANRLHVLNSIFTTTTQLNKKYKSEKEHSTKGCYHKEPMRNVTNYCARYLSEKIPDIIDVNK
jgi:hypothetical protein